MGDIVLLFLCFVFFPCCFVFAVVAIIVKQLRFDITSVKRDSFSAWSLYVWVMNG